MLLVRYYMRTSARFIQYINRGAIRAAQFGPAPTTAPARHVPAR
jgi:hypothetical protein